MDPFIIEISEQEIWRERDKSRNCAGAAGGRTASPRDAAIGAEAYSRRLN